jgi:arylsulfatase A-like enzyme
MTSTTIQTPVQTLDIAPTILQVLGLKPASLQSVQMEGTPVLPGVQ